MIEDWQYGALAKITSTSVSSHVCVSKLSEKSSYVTELDFSDSLENARVMAICKTVST